MKKKDDLEEYIQYGIAGVPELKKEEKEKYLGEFKERVIASVEMIDIHNEEKIKDIEMVLRKNKEVDKIIVNEKAHSKIRLRLMKLSKEYNKDFKVVERDTDIAVVLAKVY